MAVLAMCCTWEIFYPVAIRKIVIQNTVCGVLLYSEDSGSGDLGVGEVDCESEDG